MDGRRETRNDAKKGTMRALHQSRATLFRTMLALRQYRATLFRLAAKKLYCTNPDLTPLCTPKTCCWPWVGSGCLNQLVCSLVRVMFCSFGNPITLTTLPHFLFSQHPKHPILISSIRHNTTQWPARNVEKEGNHARTAPVSRGNPAQRGTMRALRQYRAGTLRALRQYRALFVSRPKLCCRLC